jgi:hypothetical protein
MRPLLVPLVVILCSTSACIDWKGALAANAKPDGGPDQLVTACTQHSDCPADSVCNANGKCERGVPGGGSAAMVTGSGRLTGGTLKMDATVGSPTPVKGTGGTLTLQPASSR